MEAGDLSSWVGAGIAVGAAAVAIWQGWSAREQSRVAQEALNDARQARDEAATPVFQVSDAQWVWGNIGERFVTATITVEQATPLSSLTLRIDGPDVRHLAPDTGSYESEGREKRFTAVAPGKRIDLIAQMEHEGPSPFELEVTLECVEEGGHERRWTVRRIITASEAPQPDPVPQAWRGRRGR
ncbi:hypothetical protein [Streptomyces formicae]|uniref:Integral membrane protein n=1 Tax=Streptomyces formicae TaxID=1616117 RepID=A0ABY3WKU3_9ACTN|nr:hypothetical protein [Streptomyces formicae]UNM10463.1 hypothetical protein J4032_02110 [Streptomyces formicae]